MHFHIMHSGWYEAAEEPPGLHGLGWSYMEHDWHRSARSGGKLFLWYFIMSQNQQASQYMHGLIQCDSTMHHCLHCNQVDENQEHIFWCKHPKVASVPYILCLVALHSSIVIQAGSSITLEQVLLQCIASWSRDCTTVHVLGREAPMVSSS